MIVDISGLWNKLKGINTIIKFGLTRIFPSALKQNKV